MPAMGVRWGVEACVAVEPAVGRREQAVPPALFEWLEQEEQRLKKHDGRWMDIQQYTGHLWKASNLWKTAYNPSAIISNNLQPIC